MSKEAMKLALEALEGLEARLLSMGLTHLIVYGDAEKAITNLQKELEDAQQQEPVAAQSVMTVRIWRDKNSDQNAEFKNWHKLPDGEHILYTSPPAQRTWVGLTDEERIMCRSYDPEEAVAKTEAKLKEKNT